MQRDRRESKLQVMLTESEKSAVARAAAKRGMTLSTWARAMLLKSLALKRRRR